MSKARAEMCMIKQGLREAGLPTRGIYTQEFRDMSFDQEKRWHKIKTRAHKRVETLSKTFPFAFGEYKRKQYDNQFIELLSR